ncbi:FG-GAP repeat protein [Halorientalis pallida]|uniref:Uncharacterized protein n=1 Tax=Halorientalis pallida TaxID=2479928 RepID=A0A498L9Q7_9EURY|nr:FG-GAP repeat protein [Halorientalis pallida]RXK51913.1 hypothetical protein EAF64_04570 [Halorientalis pallida]
MAHDGGPPAPPPHTRRGSAVADSPSPVSRRRFLSTAGLTGATTGVGFPDREGGAVAVGRPNEPGRTESGTGHQLRQRQRVTATASDRGDLFGGAVALDGNRALIGAPFDSDAGELAGAAYVFEFDADDEAWRQVRKLTAPDASAVAMFGSAVALDGPRAVVGAPFDGQQAPSAGAAYVFEAVGGWDGDREVRVEKLLADARTPESWFGWAVALDDIQVFVGEPGAQRPSAAGPGAVHAFGRQPDGRWRRLETLTPPSNEPTVSFGAAVALDRTVALVGAGVARIGGAPATTDSTGRCHVYRLRGGADGWVRSATLTPPSADVDGFGSRVDLAWPRAIVGSPGPTPGSPGRAHVFQYRTEPDEWARVDRFTPPRDERRHRFGGSVAVGSDRALVGIDPDRFAMASQAYVFTAANGGIRWRRAQVLPSVDHDVVDSFGGAVALDGDRALVGAPFDSRTDDNAGAAYFFAIPDDPVPSDGGRPVPPKYVWASAPGLVLGFAVVNLIDSRRLGEQLSDLAKRALGTVGGLAGLVSLAVFLLQWGLFYETAVGVSGFLAGGAVGVAVRRWLLPEPDAAGETISGTQAESAGSDRASTAVREGGNENQ